MALTDLLTQIADSIRSKDGTTDAIKATDFPQRILDIPSGGGSDLPDNIKTGTFTVAEDTTEPITIPHGLGTTPIIYHIFPDNPEYAIGNIKYTFMGGTYSDIVYITNFSSELGTRGKTFTISCDENNITIASYEGQATFLIRAGLTYRWIAWG